ncbi:MAG: HlyD family efflux transporter periplasmic adaptor subunit [Methyloprofundus sp.]|nr:HlyD family efflux transporter periplasmic adaptor subunit [Methyloprofundus sp.]
MAKRLLRWILPLLILSLALGLSFYWLKNKPKAQASAPERIIPLVETLQLQAADHTLSITAMGTVTPARKVNLTSRINGMIISVSPHFIPGDFLKKGEQIVQLDPTDYELLIKQRENALAKAQFDLKIELGQQAIAQREFKLLNTYLDEQSQELVLRKPHLALAKTAIAAAEAALKQAKLDLSRTKTTSPFNAIVLETNAHVGSWVSTFSTGTPLIKLAGLDNFWIIANLSVDKLNKINIPNINGDTGSEVKVFYTAAWGKEVYRLGTVKRLKAELEASGRMAQLIIEVPDPLSRLKKNKLLPPLILDSFVGLKITGSTLKNVIAIPESLLHDGHNIWLLDTQNHLDINPVQPQYIGQGIVYIAADQLPENARIISSNLNTPVQGMQLRVQAIVEPAHD